MTSASRVLPEPRRVLFRVKALADPRVRLFLTSATLLFVELLLIRWIPANVRYVGFFSNFLLMASFLGIGVGILLGRKGWRLPFSPFTWLLFVVVAIVFSAQLNVQINSQDELFFGLAENTAADVNFIVLPLVVALVAAVMAALALPLGPLFRAMRPLHAYAIDIVGSMVGILGFTALSAAGTNPVVWFIVVAILVLLIALGGGMTAWSIVGGLAMVGVIYAVAIQAGSGDIWSPYYRITTYRLSDGVLNVNVNGIPHQALHPLVDPTHRDGSPAPKEPFYDQVYEWFPGRTFDDVLIVGAGSGTDVAVALDRGASHVDAVEIDPAIQQIGVDEHPDRPYDDPRVTRIVNDGRAHLRTTDQQYDLVVFALPDSLTLVSTAANIRLESFLFTEEAFASVRDHLKPGGIFVLYNYYREPWLVAKLERMLADAFGAPPLVRTYSNVQAALAAGPGVAAVGGVPPGDGVSEVPDPGAPKPRPATDDWPFLYLRTGFVAPYYLVALAIILGFALVAVLGAARATGTSIRRFSPHFFVLGMAFLLLETRSLVSFSLLFGTTWIVNALAFFAILASVLVAILINARFPIRHPSVFYVGLFVALGVAFLLPPEQLLIDPPWLRYVIAAALAFTPVFFANLVFSHSFRDTATADMAFASNLLGAMVGGALEYLALLTGYRALLPLVAVLYLLAWLFATRWRRLADRDLETAAPGSESDGDGGRGATEPRPALEGTA
ncbi:MAG: spermidine synthase [Candidatus Limnocylindrales bacterium]